MRDYVLQSDGYRILKRADSRYVAASERFARCLGWQSAYDCIDKTDFDIPSPAVEHAPSYVEQDQQVVTSGSAIKSIEIMQTLSGPKVMYVNKSTFKQANQEQPYILIEAHEFSDLQAAAMQIFNFINLTHSRGSSSHSIQQKTTSAALSKRQQEVYFYILQGKNNNEIAAILGVSIRTIEAHIDILKNKLFCSSRHDIRQQGISNGDQFIIPKSLLQSSASILLP